MQNNNNKWNILQIVCFVCLLCAGTGALLFGVCEGKTYSALEKRELADFPDVTAESVFNGEFESGVTEALSDHIFGRDFFVTTKTWAQILSGKKEIDGIYIDGDRLIETYRDSDFDDKQITENISDLTGFMATVAGGIGNDHVKLMLVPSKCTLYKDELPSFLPSSSRADTIAREIRSELIEKLVNQSAAETEAQEDSARDGEEAFDEDGFDFDEGDPDKEDRTETEEEKEEETEESIEPVEPEGKEQDMVAGEDNRTRAELMAEKMVMDLRPVLTAHRDEYIYYLTDHHWTTLGAEYAYREWKQSAQPETRTVESSGQTEVVSDDFLGTDYNRIHFYKKKDEIRRFIIPEADMAKIEINDSGDRIKKDGIYDEHALDTEDQYNYFFGGNYSGIIVNTESKTGKTLLIVKDSYSNSLIPFLCRDYDTIYMVDLRYVNSGIYDYLPEGLIPDDVLIVYNEEKFMQDTHQLYLR